MRNRQLFVQVWAVLTALLGLVVIGCDVSVTGNLADALVGQPASLQDGGSAFTITLLVVGVLLFTGGIASLVLASGRGHGGAAVTE